MEEETAIEQIRKIKGPSQEQQKAIIALSLTVSLLISAVCLSVGITTVFPHIFYVPIILAAYWYPQKGILFSVGTGAAYLLEVAIFSAGSPVLLFSALIRAVVFIDIGVVISLLRREGEEYRGLANRAIKELDSERERYEAVVETQTEFICRFLPDGTTTFANQAYCKYFGKKQDEIIGNICKPNIHPDDRKEVQQLFSVLTPEHPIGSIEHRIIMQDGSVRWQQWVDQGIFDNTGHLKEYQSVGRDITKHKEAETAQKKSDEKFRSVAENSSDLLVLRNSNGEATFVSPSVRKILGYEPEEFLTLRPHDFFPPKQYATYRLEFDAIIRSGHQVRNLELRCQRKDGTEAIIIYTGDPIIEDGVITGYQAVGKDVTQERKDQQALEQSEKKYRDIVETASEGVCTFDEAFRITYANEKFNMIFGYPPGEALGKHISDLFFVENADVVEEIIAKRRRDENSGTQSRNKTKDGREIWTEANSRSWFSSDGLFTGMITLVTDITEKKEAEEALRESEQRIRILLSNLVGMAYVCSAETGHPMTFVSNGARDLTGYEPEDLTKNHRICYDNLVNPDDREEVFSEIQRAINKHRPFHIQYRIITKTKIERWVFEQGRGTYDEEGILQTIEGYITDITGKVQAEIELKRSLEEKTVLLQEVHHRVKNNLAIIVGLISMQMEKVEDPATQVYLLDTENRIMALANVHEAVYLSKDVAAINMTDHIENMGGYILASSVHNHECTLNVQKTDCQASLQTAIPVSLILNEMFTNSLKHAFVGRDNGSITIGFECTGENNILTYNDDGVGMDKSFDIASTKSLGISLIHRLATAQLKGTIEHSNNNGTKWVITFPKEE